MAVILQIVISRHIYLLKVEWVQQLRSLNRGSQFFENYIKWIRSMIVILMIIQLQKFGGILN